MLINDNMVLRIKTKYGVTLTLLEVDIEDMQIMIVENSRFSKSLIKQLTTNVPEEDKKEYTHVFISNVTITEKSVFLNGFITKDLYYYYDEYDYLCFEVKPIVDGIDRITFVTEIKNVKEIESFPDILVEYLSEGIIDSTPEILDLYSIKPRHALRYIDSNGIVNVKYKL